MKRIFGVTPKKLGLFVAVLVMLCSCIMGVIGLFVGIKNSVDSRVTLGTGNFSGNNKDSIKSLCSLNDGNTTVEIGGYICDFVNVSEDISGGVIVMSENAYSADLRSVETPKTSYVVLAAADEGAFQPSVTDEAKGTDGNDGLTYNADFQACVRFDAGNSTVSSVTCNGAAVEASQYKIENGLLYVKDAGDYTVTISSAKWQDGIDGDREISFTIKQKQLSVTWDFYRYDSLVKRDTDGYYWNYDGLAHGVYAYLDEAVNGDLTGLNTVLTVRYSLDGSNWYECDPTSTAETNNVNVAKYFVKAELTIPNSNYQIIDSVEGTGRTEFEIKAVPLSVSWNFGYSDAGYDGEYYWIYDGLSHEVTAELTGSIVAGDDVEADVKYFKGASPAYDTANSALPQNVDSYTAYALLKGAQSGNYYIVTDNNLSYVTQQFRIDRRAVTVEWNANSDGTYSWDFSGYNAEWVFNDGTDDNFNAVMWFALAESSGEEGVVAGDNIGVSVSYASVSSGTVGAYSPVVPVNAGVYSAKVSIENSNYTLKDSTLQFTIAKKVLTVNWTANDDGSYIWRYDGAAHSPEPELLKSETDTLNSGKAPVVALAQSFTKPVTVGNNYVATATLSPDADGYYLNFSLTGETQKFAIAKCIITDITFYESDGKTAAVSAYDWGEVKGAGPGYTAVAKTAVYEEGALVEREFALSVSYLLNGSEVSYGADENWNVDVSQDPTKGYRAVGTLSADCTSLYELAEENRYFKFIIRTGSATKKEIAVTWVAFVGTDEYVTLQNLIDGGGKTINIDGNFGYVSAVNYGTAETPNYAFTFVYNGLKQTPVALYIKDDGTYEYLSMSEYGSLTNAGDGAAHLIDSDEYKYAESAYECPFVIAPFDVKISWSEKTQFEFNDQKQAPEAAIVKNYKTDDWYKSLIVKFTAKGGELAEFTQTKEKFVGRYVSEAQLGDNFSAVDGAKPYEITPKKLYSSLISWTAGDEYGTRVPEDTNQNLQYYSWRYDGKKHCPVPELSFSFTQNGERITLNLVVTGATGEVGTHRAYAALDPSDEYNKNFVILNAKGEEVTPECSFKILKLQITQIIWVGTEAAENYDGETVTLADGKKYLALTNNTPTVCGALEFVYNGKQQAPAAYYYDADKLVPLTVEGAQRDVGTGTYLAHVTNDFEFAVSTECRFKITPRKLSFDWISDVKDDDGNYVFEWKYDGAEHAPSVSEFTNLAEGDSITQDDFEITKAVNAGSHTAVLTFKSPNYTAAENAEKPFIINRVDISDLFEFISDHKNAENTDYEFVWEYNAQTHSPVLSLKGEGFTLADGSAVEFEFTYHGATEFVGSHTATAAIKSATSNGANLDIRNFTLSLEKAFEIKPYTVTVIWSGNPENGTYEWVYDGKTEFKPTAKYTLWSGEVVAEVTGGGIVANTYVASVKLPDNLISNCVFATITDKNGKKVSCGEHAFKVLKREISVAWVAEGATTVDGIYYWVYDGKPHAPDAYIADKDGKPTKQKLNVEGAVINVGTGHVATAILPDSSNYKFNGDNNQSVFAITVKSVAIKWVDTSSKPDGKAFTYTYDGTTEFKPKAVITNADGSDFKIDGKEVYAIVSGGAQTAGSHTATAALDSTNYAFKADATLTQQFTVLKLKLTAGTGKDIWWVDKNAEDAQFAGIKDGVYTYEFNGREQHPVLTAKRGLTFAYEWSKIAAGGETPTTEIVRAGDYKITVTCTNPNYELPAEACSICVKVLPKTVEVKWRGYENLLYNGEDRAPTAYYEGTNGEFDLTVTVDGAHTDAGEYTATASFVNPDAVTDYVLGKNATFKYKISERLLKIQWGTQTVWKYDAQPHVVSSTVRLRDALESDLPHIGIYAVILDSDGNEIKVGSAYAQNVVNSGIYKVELRLEGDENILKNYKLSDADDGDSVQQFTIEKAKLIVAADDLSVEYGDKIPTLKATFGQKGTGEDAGVIFNGFVGADTPESLNIVKDGKYAWLGTNYNVGSTPDEYEIYIDEGMLGSLLKNYTLVDEDGNSTCRKGKLKVTAAKGTVVWYGDGEVTDPNFTYDGKAHVPEAYLQGYADYTAPLKVIFVDKDGNEIKDFKAVNAATYRVKAIAPEGYAITAFEYNNFRILPREITVLLGKVSATYGEVTTDGESPTVEDLLSPAQISSLWSYGSDVLPVEGDELKFTFSFSTAPRVVNGYVQSGEYYIVGGCAEEYDNYKVTFAYIDEETAVTDHQLDGIFFVDKADIRDESKQGTEWFYEESVIEKYEPYFIKIEDKVKDETTGEESYQFVKFVGDQSAQASFAYSKPYLVGRDEIPAPDENESYPNLDKNNTGISDKGIWIINYKIEIPNHNTYYGRWTVLIKLAEEYVIVIFVKPYEIEYGADIPENLTEQLVDGGYVEISGAVTDKEYFKQIAEAYIPLGYNKYVTNRTKVGAYNPCFRLNVEREEGEPELNVIYRKNNHDNDSNLGMYVIIPRQITVVWGPTEFTYDKAPHVPIPVLGHWINEELFVLEGIENGKVYETTDAGATVRITVTTEGNFKSTGGHKVMLTIDDPNYVIAAGDAVQVISIKGTVPWWLIFMLGALAATAITILITLIIKLKHRNKTIAEGISDEEGFYDPLDTPDEAGFDDPITVPNDGFDYDNMWNDYIS